MTDIALPVPTQRGLEVPLDQLHDSPFNPRTTYANIPQLAQQIAAVGRVLQALCVRPRWVKGEDAADGYEIVYGHRRKRGAAEAGLATVPCDVVKLTDDQARVIQAIENLGREDLNAIEEAQGYRQLIDRDGFTADQLAEKLGRSRAHVYGRLQLLNVLPSLRDALVAGDIGVETAMDIARLRVPKLQEKALQYIKAQNLSTDDQGKRSTRAIKHLLREKFTLVLKDAIFDREDATLLPAAGTCSACPKRSGNAPHFSDLCEGTANKWGGHIPGSDQLCTDPECWEAKKKAHLARKADALRAKGKEVVDGTKAMAAISATGEVKGAYVALEDVKQALTAKPKKGQPAPAAVKQVIEAATVTILNPRTGKAVAAVRRADLEAAGLASAAPATDKAAQEADQAKRRAEEEAAMVKVKAEAQHRWQLLQRVRQAAVERGPGLVELRMTAAALMACVPWEDKSTLCKLYDIQSNDLHGALERMRHRVDKMNPAELTQLVIDCLLVDNVQCSSTYHLHQKPAPLHALAHHYGISTKPEPKQADKPAAEPQATDAPATPQKRAQRPAKAPRARYVDPATGSTWTGRGLQPAWLKAALAEGKRLEDFDTQPAPFEDAARLQRLAEQAAADAQPDAAEPAEAAEAAA